MKQYRKDEVVFGALDTHPLVRAMNVIVAAFIIALLAWAAHLTFMDALSAGGYVALLCGVIAALGAIVCAREILTQALRGAGTASLLGCVAIATAAAVALHFCFSYASVSVDFPFLDGMSTEMIVGMFAVIGLYLMLSERSQRIDLGYDTQINPGLLLPVIPLMGGLMIAHFLFP